MVIIELSGGGDALKKEEEYVRGIDNYNTLVRLTSSVYGYLQESRHEYFKTKEKQRAKIFGKNFLGLCRKQEEYTKQIDSYLLGLRHVADYDWTKIKHLKRVAHKYRLKDIERDINGIRKTFERKYAPVCREVQNLIDKKEMRKLGARVKMSIDPKQEANFKYVPTKRFRSYSSRQGKKFKEYIFDNGIYTESIWQDPVTKKYYSHRTKEDEKFVRDQFNLDSLARKRSELSKIGLHVFNLNDLKSRIKETEGLKDFYLDSDVRFIDSRYFRSYAEANKLYEKFNKLTGDFGLRVSLLKDIEERLREGAELYEPNPADKIREKREKLEKKQRKIVDNFIKKNSKKIQKVNELIDRDLKAYGDVSLAILHFDRATERAKERREDPEIRYAVRAKQQEEKEAKARWEAKKAEEAARKAREQREEKRRKKPSSLNKNSNNKARKPKEEERVM